MSLKLQRHLDSEYKAILQKNHLSENGAEKLPKTVRSAFENKILSLSYKNINPECLLLEVFLKETLISLQLEVISFLKINFAFKFNIELHTIYAKPNVKEFDNNWLQAKIFKTEMKECFHTDEFVEDFFIQIKSLQRKTSDFQAKEGGWTLMQLIKVDYKLAKYQPIKGAGFIPLPKRLKLKQACINIQNNDRYCFKWVIVAAVSNNIKRKYRTSSYKLDISSKIITVNELKLDFRDLKFPLKISNIPIFIKKNPTISINLFGYDENSDLIIGPYYKSKEKRQHHINILYIEGKVQNETAGHYVWIKSLSRLVSKQITLNQCKVNVCDRCLQHFRNDRYAEHLKNCGQKLRDVLFHEKCALRFKNSVKVVDLPFVIYAKSQCFPHNNKTRAGNRLYIYMYFIKCNYDDDLNKWRMFKGPNAPKQFAEALKEDAKFYYANYSTVIKPKLPLSDDEKLQHEQNYNCCLCSTDIPRNVKVKLHCRLTGKYKGPAHHTCAFNYRIPKKFPVIFQNLSFDESLLIIKHLSDMDDDPINVRTVNNELFISLEKDIKIDSGKLELRFLIFSMFLSCGLDSLVQDMTMSDFKTFKSTYADDGKFNMIFTKIIFPYKYLNSIEQLEETCLPSRDNFYDGIINEECLLEDYANAQKLWNEFECKTLEDYLRVCLEIDILFLTDVFENFRAVCRIAYNLDPCHYYNAAEFSWDAMLKITDIKLSLPNDEDMCRFIEKGMRVGISKCFQRHSLANNKYFCDYDDQLPSKYLMSFHANDLYGRVMTEYLPQGNFKWETDLNISLSSIPDDSEYGYIFEVDLEYPLNTFENHKTFPFICHNIDDDSLSTNEVASLKTNYVIYYKNLQQCLKYGLKLKKIHRILKFKQSDWLKKYIMLNKTSKDATNSFQANVLKLMNAAIYEKIMEKSVKKIIILRKWESDGRKLGARDFIVKNGFSSLSVIDKNLVGVEFFTNINNHAPVYLEFIFSELVKLKMYSFHYEYIMSKYKTNVQLNYIDTDSLIYTITTDDLYKDMKNDILSMINPTDCYNFRLLQKTLGMIKDAYDGVVLKEFIGFRSKLYTLKTETMGVKNQDCKLRDNILNYLSLSDYTNLLYKNSIFCNSIYTFKFKLYNRYVMLLDNDLPLNYLENSNNEECNNIIEKLRFLYYQKLVCANDFDEEMMMDTD